MKTLLIDSNNLLWRSSGKPPLTHDGIRTEAVYIGINMLRTYLQRFEPDSCIMVWDGGRDKRRTEKFPDYKRKKKEPTPVEKQERKILFSQADLLKLGFELLGLTQCQCKGFEADDIIYNFVKKSDPTSEAIVVSTDEDMFQLFTIKKNLIVYSPTKDKVMTKSDVEEKFGFPIEYFATYKALAGDSSDNIPGVNGIGPVKAKKLIEVFQKDDDDISSDGLHILSQFHSQYSEYESMLDLIKFKNIEDHELVNGYWEKIPDTNDQLNDAAYAFIDSLGFKKHLNNFVEFMVPFNKYWWRVK